ncbi:hypothetical protein Dsin_000747 [Dipteronia sinensis]|uniref:Uncharacterized protein n=1 Tax=Dipteronia sinensis TaxID=43782 RepID=A0AAE0B2H8_9ROSI|nr:hypothetical protein Dsin_000747 [Dipteronia sinensis]
MTQWHQLIANGNNYKIFLRGYVCLMGGLYGPSSVWTALQCNSSSRPGPPSGSGDGDSVLDAFFLGNALSEALNDTVGEFLSTVGRLQAEQQKQVQEFQNYDYHHYLRLLELPPKMQKAEFTLRAFNVETSRATDIASDPKIGLMRLVWWQEAIDKLYANKLIEHPWHRHLHWWYLRIKLVIRA